MRGRRPAAHLEVARIQSEVNRLFEALLRLREGERSPVSGWSPAVDVAESATHLVVEAEVPGVDPESLEVITRGGELVLRGRRDPSALRLADGAEVLHDEREYGLFERTIPLGTAVNTRQARARLDRGVLRVELPKVENRRGEAVRIPVDTAGEEDGTRPAGQPAAPLTEDRG